MGKVNIFGRMKKEILTISFDCVDESNMEAYKEYIKNRIRNECDKFVLGGMVVYMYTIINL